MTYVQLYPSLFAFFKAMIRMTGDRMPPNKKLERVFNAQCVPIPVSKLRMAESQGLNVPTEELERWACGHRQTPKTIARVGETLFDAFYGNNQ